MQRVHVFIVNYNSAKLLIECLESLRDEPIAQVHVIDNFHSTSARESVMMIPDIFPRVSVALNDKNLGFGPALNKAILDANLAPTDIIWLLNPDTTVTAGVVTALVEYMQTGYDIISPKIFTGSLSKPLVWFAGGILDRRQVRTRHIGLGSPRNTTAYSEDGPEETSFITGAAMMMLCSTWTGIGGFREGFFLYWEDAELCERAVSKGYRLGVASSASIWHAVGGTGSTSGMSTAYYYYMQRNRLWFGRQWKSRRGMLFGTGLRETLALTLRPLKEERGRMAKTAASCRGLYHGLFHKPL